jgi:hypothetical protein
MCLYLAQSEPLLSISNSVLSAGRSRKEFRIGEKRRLPSDFDRQIGCVLGWALRKKLASIRRYQTQNS